MVDVLEAIQKMQWIMQFNKEEYHLKKITHILLGPFKHKIYAIHKMLLKLVQDHY